MGCTSSTQAQQNATASLESAKKDAASLQENTTAAVNETIEKVGEEVEKVVDGAKKEVVGVLDADKLDMKDLIEKESFHNVYSLGEVLGRGNYSVVRKGSRKDGSGTIVAVKCIKESSLTHEDREALKIETAILKTMDSPHIIKMIGFYEEKNEKMYYIVTEFVGGGELFDRIIAKEYYSEEDAQKLVITIATAIQYCHTRGIVHRDLKPENILLTSKDDDDSIKIADFGFAKQYDTSSDDALSTSCGTPGYVAPEILNGKSYGKEVDMWSLGVIIYILLCGYPPFHHENQKELFRQIRAANFKFDEEYWSQVSDSAKDLIRKLLVIDGQQRLTVEQLLEHEWLKTKVTGNLTDIQAGLRVLQNKRKVKAGINAVIAQNRIKKLLVQGSLDNKEESAEEVKQEAEQVVEAVADTVEQVKEEGQVATAEEASNLISTTDLQEKVTDAKVELETATTDAANNAVAAVAESLPVPAPTPPESK